MRWGKGSGGKGMPEKQRKEVFDKASFSSTVIKIRPTTCGDVSYSLRLSDYYQSKYCFVDATLWREHSFQNNYSWIIHLFLPCLRRKRRRWGKNIRAIFSHLVSSFFSAFTPIPVTHIKYSFPSSSPPLHPSFPPLYLMPEPISTVVQVQTSCAHERQH